ncbi:MAG: hypothetical protein ACW98F_16335 [Candidatus Hodarchaeales archaeon]|jgi:hypothetical protein
MVSRRENMKRYIKTITNQLPQYFSGYSKEDQRFLETFIDPLRFSEEADYRRTHLAQRFHNARKYFSGHALYLSYPFFWFIDSYFENAEVSLKISSFHADFFYDYLLPILRGTAGQKNGVFQLIKDNVPLSDLKWEELQYKSAKLHIPLKFYELDIIKTIYTQLRSHPLHILNPRRVRSMILNQHDIPRVASKFPKLLAILNTRWTVWPNYPAFGIQSFYFHFRINSRSTLKEIIDFNTTKAGLLSTSSVYTNREVKDDYMGIMHLPERSEKQISLYLERKKEEGQLIEYSLAPVTENRWTYSLTQYQTELGWQELNKSSWMSRVRLMKLKTIPRRRKKIELEYHTPVKDQDWNIRNLEDPLKAIDLVCKKNIFNYTELLADVYSPDELKLLNVLINKHSIFIDYQLKRLLELLPTTRIAGTLNNYYIFTYLTSTMTDQIRTDLEWPLHPLLPTHTAVKRTQDMFDKELLCWHLPNILTE